MTIDIKDIITLDDNKKYVVTSKTSYENKDYYLLLDKDEKSEYLICYLENNELIETEDKDLNTKLLELFLKAIENDNKE